MTEKMLTGTLNLNTNKLTNYKDSLSETVLIVSQMAVLEHYFLVLQECQNMSKQSAFIMNKEQERGNKLQSTFEN